MVSKAVVWSVWSINSLVTAIYCIMALYTTNSVRLAVLEKKTAYAFGLAAACVLGFFTCGAYVIYSLFMLAMRSVRPSSTGFGFVLGSTLHISLLQLLSGLVLQSGTAQFSTDIDSYFSANPVDATIKKQVYTATFAFDYILAFTYLVSFFVLSIGSCSAFRQEDDVEARPVKKSTSTKYRSEAGNKQKLSAQDELAPPQKA